MAFELHEVNQRFLDALGLKPDDVTSVTIHLTVRDLPRVTVQHVVLDAAANELASVLEGFTLYPDVERDEAAALSGTGEEK